MLIRFADADVLPYDFADFADTMHRYATELKKLLADKQEEIRDRNEAIDQHLYDAASDPRHPLLAPPKQEVPPFLNFAPLDNALASLDKAPAVLQGNPLICRKNGGAHDENLAALNSLLIQTERRLTSSAGLPPGRGSNT